jgi:hypothetical protein
LIIKAAGACLIPNERVEEFDAHGNAFYTSVPQDVMSKVSQLVALWQRNGPEIVNKG